MARTARRCDQGAIHFDQNTEESCSHQCTGPRATGEPLPGQRPGLDILAGSLAPPCHRLLDAPVEHGRLSPSIDATHGFQRRHIESFKGLTPDWFIKASLRSVQMPRVEVSELSSGLHVGC